MYNTEAEALAESTGFVNMPPLVGYLPFEAANFLVETGAYVFEQSTPWGYVMRAVRPKPAPLEIHLNTRGCQTMDQKTAEALGQLFATAFKQVLASASPASPPSPSHPAAP